MCVTMVPRSALSYSGLCCSHERNQKISQSVLDPLTLLTSLEESNTPNGLLLATRVPPDLFSACVVPLAQRTLAENRLTPALLYKCTKAPAANQEPSSHAFTHLRFNDRAYSTCQINMF